LQKRARNAAPLFILLANTSGGSPQERGAAPPFAARHYQRGKNHSGRGSDPDRRPAPTGTDRARIQPFPTIIGAGVDPARFGQSCTHSTKPFPPPRQASSIKCAFALLPPRRLCPPRPRSVAASDSCRAKKKALNSRPKARFLAPSENQPRFPVLLPCPRLGSRSPQDGPGGNPHCSPSEIPSWRPKGWGNPCCPGWIAPQDRGM